MVSAFKCWQTLFWVQGRCTTAAPPRFQLSEPLPAGGCAIRVKEEFLDVPLRTDQLWVDSLYVAMSSPGSGNSSVLYLQVTSPTTLFNCF